MNRIVGIAIGCAVLVLGAHPAVGGRAAPVHNGARAATPYLQLVGTIPVAGQATVATGDTAKAYGSSFCGAPGCSPVTLTIGARVAARGVEVSENGTFRAAFEVSEDPGRYTVTASQRAADGSTLEDSATLIVAVGDTERKVVPEEVALRVLNAREGRFLASIRPRRCCAGKAAFFQRLVAAGRWRTVKRVVLARNSTRRFTASLPHGISKVRMLVPRSRFGRRPLLSRPLLVRR
jgi:hypothetical protein